MHLPPFKLDQWLATYEFASPPIRYNLASSTGPKWTVGELLALGGGAAHAALDSLAISYAPPNGSADLRAGIARFHDVDPDWVVVTTGASEAISALFCLVAEPGANLVLPFPVFPTMPVMARAWGLEVKTYELSRRNAFAHDVDLILDAVNERTRLVLVNSPHNPTGSVMPAAQIARLAAALAERDVPLVVDEVYHPLYFDAVNPTAARLASILVMGDMSKALSLSGLRVGWLIVPDPRMRERLINLRSYFTISNSPVTEALATIGLAAAPAIVARLETVTRANLALLDDFMHAHREAVGWARPVGGTIAFPWLTDGSDSRPLCEALARGGVLVAPGDCYDAPAHFRIGFGAQVEGFGDALALASDIMRGRGL